MRKITVTLLLDFDNEEDIHPQLMLEDTLPDYVGFEILADSAGIDDNIPEALTNSEE